ncbi:tetratricopeptide repeat protein [Kitasatospora azatica]|uniref:tetratricopeptide repeat protein n=1 Tax=Kitasatospora azatica TaxID=58347 RepID=UPI00068B63AA|nr:tetratricopeptide repeat protein [Kitasatospora azatica]
MIDYSSQLVADADAARNAGDCATAAAKYLEAASLGDPNLMDAIHAELSKLRAKADAGELDAQAAYGHMALESGLDVAGGLANLERAAAAGNPLAQRVLGHALANGTGVAPDTTRAAVLFRQAMEGGDEYGAFNLAALYFHGEGVPADPEKAFALLERAAEGGITEAMCQLGQFLSESNRVAEALSWFLRAAEAGNAQGMHAAGYFYRDGHGVAVDEVQALRWFLAMQNVGSRDAMHDAMELAKRMSVTDVREAARLADRAPDGEFLIEIARPS